MCDLKIKLFNEKIGYTFFTENPKMVFKQEGYKQYANPLNAFEYRKFLDDNYLSVCIDKECLLFCMFYGDTIIESLYIKKGYINNIQKAELGIYNGSNNWGEIQIQKFYTGRKEEITVNIFKSLLLYADEFTLKNFFTMNAFSYSSINNTDDYFTMYGTLSDSHKKVSLYYFNIKNIWNSCDNNIALFKNTLKNDGIPISTFFDKTKSIKNAYRNFKWNRQECKQLLKTL